MVGCQRSVMPIYLSWPPMTISQ